jgi:hypothetical protein
MTDKFEADYQTAIRMLNQENDLVWKRFSVFLLANSIVVAAAGLFMTNWHHIGDGPRHVYTVLLLSGMLLCLLWSITTLHGFFVCSKYNTIARELEKQRCGNVRVIGESLWQKLEVRLWFIPIPPAAALGTIFVFLQLYFFMLMMNPAVRAGKAEPWEVWVPYVLIAVVAISVIILGRRYCERKRKFGKDMKGRYN